MHRKINSNIIPLEDTDKMPFGQYKGILMQDVPCNYLHWFYTTCNVIDGTPGERVLGYIIENLNALKLENEDLIWERKK